MTEEFKEIILEFRPEKPLLGKPIKEMETTIELCVPM